MKRSVKCVPDCAPARCVCSASVVLRKMSEEAKDLFDFYDKNRDGVLSQSEIASVIRALGANPSEAEIRELVRKYDSSGRDSLGFADFMQIYREAMATPISKRELMTYFKFFDKDGSGRIDRDEFKNTMTTLGERMTEDEVNMILEDADMNGNGDLDLEAFTSMLLTKPSS